MGRLCQMQTFSNMRRDSFNHSIINPTYILFGLAMVYALFSPIFYYASPLVGLSFYYLTKHNDEENIKVIFLLIFIYICFMELNRGLFLFSFLIFYLILYSLGFIRFLKESIHCQWCFSTILVTISYIGYYFFNLFLTTIFNIEAPSIGWAYLVFIFTDIVLVFVLL